MQRRIGRFELADGGSIFLDEVGDLPLKLQAKLLRVLQEGEFERLGNPHTIRVDVRVLAATNRDLRDAVAKGAFREDLYYRLNVFPDLSCRRCASAARTSRPWCSTSWRNTPRSWAGLPCRCRRGPWTACGPIPGRATSGKLENVIERALILSPGQTLLIDEMLDTRAAAPAKSSCLSLQEAERNHVCAVLEETDWQIEGPGGAAQRLAINPSTLRSRMRKLGIERPRPSAGRHN